ncbi:MAG: amidohydrolase family protein [Acidobacteria bacterium]|nr:amidohydrolase family protein [Acidobacteriota bacterium]
MKYLRATGAYGILTLLLFCGIAIGQGPTVTVPASLVFYPDTIVHNAKLVTVDDATVGINTPTGTIAQAMAIRDDKIMAVGTNAQILAMAGPRTEKIDVKGRMVMPAIIDTHDHAHGSVANRWQDKHPDPNQTLVKTYQIAAGKTDAEITGSITAAIQAHVKNTPPGTFGLITLNNPPRDPNATGLEAELNFMATWLYEGHFPKSKIDPLAPNHPIQLYNLPAMIVNEAFVTALDKQYGHVTKKAMNMDDVGRVRETATQYGRMMASDQYYKTRMPDLAQALEEGLAIKTATGVSTYTSHLMGERFQDAFRLLQREGRMPLRMAFYHWEALAAGFSDTALFYRKMGDWTGMGGDYFWNLGVSLGAIDSSMPRTCSNTEAPKRLKDLEFCQNAPGSRMYETTKTAIANWMRISTTHAEGDKGIDYFMDAVEEGMKENPGITLEYIRSLRLGTDHCNLSPSPDQLPRMAKLGMFKSCAGGNIEVIRWVGPGKYPDFYIRQIAPVRTAIQAGVRITSESTSNFFKGAQQFITRKTDDGKVVNLPEAVDRNTALKMMTTWAAWTVFREDKQGTLKPGVFADYIVLNNDFFTVPENQIEKIYPLMTVIGGKTRMLREEFAKELGRSPVGPQVDWNKPPSFSGGDALF